MVTLCSSPKAKITAQDIVHCAKEFDKIGFEQEAKLFVDEDEVFGGLHEVPKAMANVSDDLFIRMRKQLKQCS